MWIPGNFPSARFLVSITLTLERFRRCLFFITHYHPLKQLLKMCLSPSSVTPGTHICYHMTLTSPCLQGYCSVRDSHSRVLGICLAASTTAAELRNAAESTISGEETVQPADAVSGSPVSPPDGLLKAGSLPPESPGEVVRSHGLSGKSLLGLEVYRCVAFPAEWEALAKAGSAAEVRGRFPIPSKLSVTHHSPTQNCFVCSFATGLHRVL